jgi:hypothetical protein
VRALRSLGDVHVRAVAGPQLRAAGAETVVPQEDLAVIGFSGIVAKLPLLFRTRDRLLEEFERFRPDAVVLVDYPGFNLRLGRCSSAAGRASSTTSHRRSGPGTPSAHARWRRGWTGSRWCSRSRSRCSVTRVSRPRSWVTRCWTTWRPR